MQLNSVSYQGGGGGGAGGRPAAMPSVTNSHNIPGLAAGDVPLGRGPDHYAGYGGYHDVGIIDKVRRNPLYAIGAAFVLFLFVSGGSGGDGDRSAAAEKNLKGGAPIPAPLTAGADANASKIAAAASDVKGTEKQDDASAKLAAAAAGLGGEGGTDASDGGAVAASATTGTQKAAKSTAAMTSSGAAEGGTTEIAWLMAFPMSGATFVLSLASALSPTQRTMAVNRVPFGMSHDPVFEDSPQGPFYINLEDINGEREKGGTTEKGRYALTQTSCAGVCLPPCPPGAFIETLLTFDAGCRSTAWFDETDGVLKYGMYGASRVSKAVHVVRDPLSNVVSRFGAYWRYHVGRPNAFQYTSNEEGFMQFCKDSDAINVAEERNLKFFPPDVEALLEKVPCRDEFFRYVQWHNLAFEESKYRNLTYHVVYYEDFDGESGEDPGEAVEDLGMFLHLLEEGEKVEIEGLPKFQGASMYHSYYTKEEREAIWAFLEAVALPSTWETIARYQNLGVNVT